MPIDYLRDRTKILNLNQSSKLHIKLEEKNTWLKWIFLFFPPPPPSFSSVTSVAYNLLYSGNSLEPLILLPLPFKWEDYGYAPLCLIPAALKIKHRTSFMLSKNSTDSTTFTKPGLVFKNQYIQLCASTYLSTNSKLLDLIYATQIQKGNDSMLPSSLLKSCIHVSEE